jgi:hypothetical protein
MAIVVLSADRHAVMPIERLEARRQQGNGHWQP